MPLEASRGHGGWKGEVDLARLFLVFFFTSKKLVISLPQTIFQMCPKEIFRIE